MSLNAESSAWNFVGISAFMGAFLDTKKMAMHLVESVETLFVSKVENAWIQTEFKMFPAQDSWDVIEYELQCTAWEDFCRFSLFS